MQPGRWLAAKSYKLVSVKIALAQINPTVGDFEGNTAKILKYSRLAEEARAELVLFPELAVTGYPPRDLVEKPAFLERASHAVNEIAHSATAGRGLAVLVGSITAAPPESGKRVYNSAILLRDGHTAFVQSKRLLPFYDVFDEQRTFASAGAQKLFELGGKSIALTICEDAWNDSHFWPRRLYTIDPTEELILAGGRLMINISASPYFRGKRELRINMLSAIARRYKVPVAMVNQVGGNDSLIFDGSSFAVAADGTLLAEARSFEEDLVLVDTEAVGAPADSADRHGASLTAPVLGKSEETEAVYQALALGTRDYIRKCGFSQAIVGLSGGVDSALVASIAVDAVGAENVTGVGMPSQFSSKGSIHDAQALAANLGIRFDLIPIREIFQQYSAALAPIFAGYRPDITEENLQARIRGTLLMALANKFKALVLATGNKSEMSVGYSTLYGDMVGALAVIGDVFKTDVYRLCRHVNREREIIPRAILEKPPSAELRPDQKDTDSLPPYPVLDPILEAYVERYETPERIAAESKIDLATINEVVKLVERSEYKRQQAAPVLKVTPKSFGAGRRFPIAARTFPSKKG